MGEKKNQITFVEWLGFRKKPEFTAARWLGPVISFLLSVAASGLLLVAFSLFWRLAQAVWTIGPYADDSDGSAIRNIGLVVAGVVGVPFLVWRSLVAERQVRISRQSLFNQKLNEAVQGLTARREVSNKLQGQDALAHTEWEDDVVARVIAIDRIESLANERLAESPRIVRLLAAYVRANFPAKNLDFTEPDFERAKPRLDLQKAVDVIGLILKLAVDQDKSEWRLDLRECNFDGVNFTGGYFRAANFIGSRFEGSTFRETNFEGAIFIKTLLNFVDFYKANLRGGWLDFAVLNRPETIPSGMGANLNMADIKGISLAGADLSALTYLGGDEEVAQTFGTKDTILSDDLEFQFPNHAERLRAFRAKNLSGGRTVSDADQLLIHQVEDAGLQYWSPFDSSDLMTGRLRQDLRASLGMTSWPY